MAPLHSTSPFVNREGLLKYVYYLSKLLRSAFARFWLAFTTKQTSVGHRKALMCRAARSVAVSTPVDDRVHFLLGAWLLNRHSKSTYHRSTGHRPINITCASGPRLLNIIRTVLLRSQLVSTTTSLELCIILRHTSAQQWWSARTMQPHRR